MRQGGALGEPGGAGGVLDVDGVVELEQGLALTQPLDRHPARPRPQLLPAHRPGRDLVAQHHPPRKGGELCGHLVEHVQVVGLAEARRQDQGRHPGLAQGIGQLRGPVGGVDVDQHGPDLGGGVLEDDPLGVVRRPDPDPLATLDPQPQQAPGHLLDGRMELGVGQAHTLVHADQRVVVGDPGRRPVQVLPDGLTQQRHRAGPVHIRGHAGRSMAASLPRAWRQSVTAPFCDDTLQNPTWRAFPAALRVVGNLLDAGAVHPRHSARGPPAGPDGEQPDRLLTRRHRRSPDSRSGWWPRPDPWRAAMKATITVVVSGSGSRDDASVGTDGGREALRYEHVIAA